MTPAAKRFTANYAGIADAIASVDIDQEDRELVARTVAEALSGRRDFNRETFELLASDPLVPCAGVDGEGTNRDGERCGVVIRIAMHNSDAEDGRSFAWSERRPVVRCVSCGSRAVLGGV